MSAEQESGRIQPTSTVRIDPDDPGSLPEGRVDYAALDRTTEADLISQQREDDAEAMRDMARFARRVRRRMGLTQVEFARRIDVSHETIRNWEQGKRGPTGAARTFAPHSGQSPGERASGTELRGRAGLARRLVGYRPAASAKRPRPPRRAAAPPLRALSRSARCVSGDSGSGASEPPPRSGPGVAPDRLS